MRKGIMAMEGLDLDIPPVEEPTQTAPADDTPPADTPPVERTAEEVEAERIEGEIDEATAFVEAPEGELLEATDAEGELEANDASIDEACDTVETLDDMADAVRGTIEEGGMNEQTAAAMNLAVEHFRTRLAFPAASRKPFPALEGFGDKATRLNQTRLALEGIEKTAASIGKAILAALQKAVEWLKKFYAHITDAAARFQARAGQLEKIAGSLAGKAASADAKVGTGPFGRLLQSEGKVAEGAAFVSQYEAYTKEVAALAASQVGIAAFGGAALGELIEADEAGFEVALNKIVDVFAKAAQGQQSANKDYAVEGSSVYEAKLGFANKSFYSVIGAADSIGKSTFFVADTTGAGAVEQVADVSPLDAKEAAEVAKLVGAHLESYKGFNEELSATDKALAAISKASDGEGAAAKAEVTAVARAYIGALTKGAKGLRSFDIQVAKAALDYVAASLQALKAEAAPAAAEAAPAADAAAA